MHAAVPIVPFAPVTQPAGRLLRVMTVPIEKSENWVDVRFTLDRHLTLKVDPNQLPPIGTGRVFADLIQWLRAEHSESIVRLEHNVRQMENEISGRGRAILALAGLYVRDEPGVDDEAVKADAETRP
jgi:exodeoxyribonuclease V alpha subunit